MCNLETRKSKNISLLTTLTPKLSRFPSDKQAGCIENVISNIGLQKFTERKNYE